MESPKNIRQIGENQTNYHIYVEDYVVTFLNQLAGSLEDAQKLVMLLGQEEQQEENRYFFIYGAYCMPGTGARNEETLLSDENRDYAERMKKEFFFSHEELGVVILESRFTMTNTREENLFELFSFWKKEYALLFRINVSTGEKAWRVKTRQEIITVNGYAVFYAQNKKMQDYLIRWHEENQDVTREMVSDKAAGKFRAMLEEKAEREPSGFMSLFYMAGMVVMILLSLLLISTINRYDKMAKAEQELCQLLEDMKEQENLLKMEEEQAAHRISEEKETMADETERMKDNETYEEVLPEERTEAGEQTISEEQATTETQEMPIEQEIQQPEDNQQEAPASEAGAPTVEESAVPALHMESYQEYVVQPKDTLAGISLRFYHSMDKVNMICEINGITNEDEIMAGEKILLP